MHQLQRSWVRSQHPSAQWNLRGGRLSSAIPPKNIYKKHFNNYKSREFIRLKIRKVVHLHVVVNVAQRHVKF
jgi:hypothetical protein